MAEKVKCGFQPYDRNAMHVTHATQCTQEVANDMAGICHVIYIHLLFTKKLVAKNKEKNTGNKLK